MMMQGKQMIQVNWNQWSRPLVNWKPGASGADIISIGEQEVVLSATRQYGGLWDGNFGYTTIPLTFNDKMYLSCMYKGGKAQTLWLHNGMNQYGIYTNQSESYIKNNMLFRCNDENSVGCWPRTQKPEVNGSIDYFKNITIIHLTQMFGQGNEPTTAVQFESWLIDNGINPNEYIPYNVGETRMMTKPSWIP